MQQTTYPHDTAHTRATPGDAASVKTDTRAAQGCARAAQGSKSLTPVLRKAAQGPQGFFHLLFLYRNKFYSMCFLSRMRNKYRKPCGPCARVFEPRKTP
jgi:hypothetical protein